MTNTFSEVRLHASLKERHDKIAKTLEPFDYYFSKLPSMLSQDGDTYRLKITKQSAHFNGPIEPYQYWAGYMCENPKGDYTYGKKDKLASLAYNPIVTIYDLWTKYDKHI